MRWTAVALLSVAVIVVACGPARTPAAGEEPTIASVPPSEVSTEIVGGTAVQQRILREVLAGLGPHVFEHAEITEPGPWGTGGPGSVALILPYDEQDLRREWQSWLVAQAFALRSKELGLAAVSDVARDSAGDWAMNLGPLSDSPAPQATLGEARRAAEQAADAARRSGAEIRRIEILEAHGYAFLVEVRAQGDPASFLRNGLPRVLQAIGGPEPMDSPFAGDYTIVLDAEGNPVWRGAEAKFGDGSYQSGGATRWELEGCSPYFRGGPPGSGPPPCPADTDQDSGGAQIEMVAPSKVTTKILGATPEQGAVLREILSGLGPTRLEAVEIVTEIEKGWGPPGSVGFEIRVPRNDAYALWQGERAGEVFTRRSLELGLPTVAYLAESDWDWADSMLFDDRPTPPPPLTRPEAEKALSQVAELAKEHGASTRVQLLKPDRLAFAIYFTAEKPAEFLLRGLDPALAPIDDLERERHDGRYVKVVDANGKFVLEKPGSVRPDLEGCYPYVVIGGLTPEPEPPPCPAK